MTTACQETDPVAYHGEGAVWYDGWGGLRFVDMLAGDVLSLSASGAIDRLHIGSPVAAMLRPRRDGGFVVATERGFSLWTGAGEEWVSPPLWDDLDRRFNEGGVDPAGNLICGMKSTERPGAGEVLRLTTDRTVVRLFGGVVVSNGLGFTADGRRMYYVDSRTRRIDVFDVDESGTTLTGRRPFVMIEDGAGGPDGLWVDALDGVWVALFRGSAVRHYTRDGDLAEIVEVPASQVSSCTFGGADLSTLFITTSRDNLPDGAEPLAGSVFSAPAGVAGQPVRLFAG
jgi:sugar lactone lactonase YvrE